MVKIKQNTSVVDVALNLSGSITGLPAVVDQLPAGARVGFSSGWTGELGPALNMYGNPRYLRDGVDTSNGFFYTEDPALLFEGSRTHEVCFTTGEDIQTISCIVVTRNGDSKGLNVFLYVNGGAIRAYVGGSYVTWGPAVEPNTTYHVVLSVDVDNTKCNMYVNGRLTSSISSFSGYQNPNVYLVGTLNYLNGSYPFKGVIHYHRLFNYALSAYDAALLWNNGDPTGYMLPSSWKCPALDFPTSVYTASRNTFSSNSQNVESIMTYDVPAANGFSGLFMRNEAIKNVSMFCSYRNRDGYRDIPTKITMEYRSNCDLYNDPNKAPLLLSANDAEAKAATIIYSYDDNPGSLFCSPESPDSWAEMRILSIESVGCVAEYLSQGLIQPLPNIWRDVADIGQTWTPDLQGLELDLNVPVYDTLGKEKAPYSTDLFALKQAITDGEGYLKTLSNLIE